MKDTSSRRGRPRRRRYRALPDSPRCYGIQMAERAYVIREWDAWPGFIKGHFRSCLESIRATPAPCLP